MGFLPAAGFPHPSFDLLINIDQPIDCYRSNIMKIYVIQCWFFNQYRSIY